MTEDQTSEQNVSLDEVQELAKRFIELANQIKNEGRSPAVVNGALMFASAIYATYTAAGNEGYLHESGIDKIAGSYRRNLTKLQELKKAAKG